MNKLSIFWSNLRRSLRIMARNKVGFAGLILTIVIVLIAFIAPNVVKPDPGNIDLVYAKASLAHPFGFDNQGRDVFTQVLLGGRSVITVAALAAFFTLFLGTFLGSLAGVVGGWVETLINASAELVITIPHFPLLLVIAGFVRFNSGIGIALIIGAISWGGLMRTIRAQVLSLKERDYVQAARALGLPTSHLLFNEILPNMMSYILIQFIMSMTNAIYYMTVLVFLGITPLNASDWGNMVTMANRMGAMYDKDSRWFLFAPILAIVLLSFSLVSMTRSLDELFNPRLRAGE